MTANARQDTARIYQFPTRPRAMARSSATGSAAIIERQAMRTPMADFGNGWYHDAAIQKDPVVPHAG